MCDENDTSKFDLTPHISKRPRFFKVDKDLVLRVSKEERGLNEVWIVGVSYEIDPDTNIMDVSKANAATEFAIRVV